MGKAITVRIIDKLPPTWQITPPENNDAQRRGPGTVDLVSSNCMTQLGEGLQG